MEQKIALAPALGLTAAHGPARVEPAPPGQFMDFAEMGFVVVSSLAINWLFSYLCDLIKDAFADKPTPTVAIHQLDMMTAKYNAIQEEITSVEEKQ